MTDECKTVLLKLIQDTNIAIAEADKAHVKGAVNWADLKCDSAEYAQGVTPEGATNEYFRVIINEAAPFADEFRFFIADRLKEMGWTTIEVTTEW